jgi:hypothetical protein
MAFTWHYGIVLHKPEDNEIHLEGGYFASVAEIYTDKEGIPLAWSEASLTYFEGIDDLKDTLKMIIEDLDKTKPIIYPDDFDLDRIKDEL